MSAPDLLTAPAPTATPVEGSGVPDYFDELLERIRDIRASERRMYLRVKEIFARDPARTAA